MKHYNNLSLLIIFFHFLLCTIARNDPNRKNSGFLYKKKQLGNKKYQIENLIRKKNKIYKNIEKFLSKELSTNKINLYISEQKKKFEEYLSVYAKIEHQKNYSMNLKQSKGFLKSEKHLDMLDIIYYKLTNLYCNFCESFSKMEDIINQIYFLAITMDESTAKKIKFTKKSIGILELELYNLKNDSNKERNNGSAKLSDDSNTLAKIKFQELEIIALFSHFQIYLKISKLHIEIFDLTRDDYNNKKAFSKHDVKNIIDLFVIKKENALQFLSFYKQLSLNLSNYVQFKTMFENLERTKNKLDMLKYRQHANKGKNIRV